ncbi:hypothetical protein BKA93DRAFT_750665 [Sparassis latifolia]
MVAHRVVKSEEFLDTYISLHRMFLSRFNAPPRSTGFVGLGWPLIAAGAERQHACCSLLRFDGHTDFGANYETDLNELVSHKLQVGSLNHPCESAKHEHTTSSPRNGGAMWCAQRGVDVVAAQEAWTRRAPGANDDRKPLHERVPFPEYGARIG